MKPISVHVSEPAYETMKSMAARSGRPVAELIRQAMDEFIERKQQGSRSFLTVAPFASGAMLKQQWDRAELMDEMRGR